MEKTSFWSRVGHWFKPAGRGHQTMAADSLSDRIADDLPPPDIADASAASNESPIVSKLRKPRAMGQLARLEEEYARVVRVMESVEAHLGSQAEGSDRMAQSLDRVAESLSHAPEAAAKQLELLAAIREQAMAEAARAQRVEENLSQLPQIADAQRETMVSIGRQLDLARETSERVADTMERFERAVTNLGDVTNASIKTLQDMRGDALERDERIANLLEEQGKRFILFALGAMSLAVVAAVVGLIALFR